MDDGDFYRNLEDDREVSFGPTPLDQIAADLAYRTAAAAGDTHHCTGWLPTELDFYVRCPYCPDMGHPEDEATYATEADRLEWLLAKPLPTILPRRPLPPTIDPNDPDYIPF